MPIWAIRFLLGTGNSIKISLPLLPILHFLSCLNVRLSGVFYDLVLLEKAQFTSENYYLLQAQSDAPIYNKQ